MEKSCLILTTFRPYWKCYYANTDGIVFVIDSADIERLIAAKSELTSMLQVHKEHIMSKHTNGVGGRTKRCLSAHLGQQTSTNNWPTCHLNEWLGSGGSHE